MTEQPIDAQRDQVVGRLGTLLLEFEPEAPRQADHVADVAS